MKLTKLNLGCGSNKLPGYINIDGEASCKPDLVCNFALEKLPYKSKSIDEIVMFHCIEHISRSLHQRFFTEIWRLLKPTGTLLISYPEFLKAVENWKTNYRGQKDFWENVIYGRQSHPGDFHVTIIHTPDFILRLKSWGFKNIKSTPERPESYNTILSCQRGAKSLGYEDLIKKDMLSHKFKRIQMVA